MLFAAEGARFTECRISAGWANILEEDTVVFHGRLATAFYGLILRCGLPAMFGVRGGVCLGSTGIWDVWYTKSIRAGHDAAARHRGCFI